MPGRVLLIPPHHQRPVRATTRLRQQVTTSASVRGPFLVRVRLDSPRTTHFPSFPTSERRTTITTTSAFSRRLQETTFSPLVTQASMAGIWCSTETLMPLLLVAIADRHPSAIHSAHSPGSSGSNR